MHMDVGFTLNKNYVFQLYVDDYTRESYLDVLDSKDQVLERWVTLKNHLELANFPSKFAFVKTDSEPLYRTAAWIEHVKESSVEHEFSSRYRHDQLGVAERAMQAIGISFRAMMFQGNAPPNQTHQIASDTQMSSGVSRLQKRIMVEHHARRQQAPNSQLTNAYYEDLCFV